MSESLPAAAEHIDLRTKAGWGAVDEETANATIKAAAHTICLRQRGRLVGVARVMGDGALFFFVADLIIAPELHGSGCGARLMRRVTAYFGRCAKPGATIALLPLRGREAF
jgi:predicted GNAT family N-acyltransferase